ncbi:MAG: YceI family protein [Betaproteobacteria bacterium]|nr:YceI family protein [Betaproteobacteria bacterium]
MNMPSRLRIALGAGALSLASLTALAAPALAADAAPTAQAPKVQPYAPLQADPAGSYTVDADHSGAQFSIGHAGVAMLTGVFGKVTGSYTFDPRDPKADKADITIPVNSLDTFLPARTKDVLAGQFLDADKYPTMHFVGTRYVPHGRHGGVLHGELTLHGVTRPVAFRVHLVGAGEVSYLPKPWGGYLSGFVATTVIDRTDFGIDAFSAGIGHKVRVRVEIEGVRNPS